MTAKEIIEFGAVFLIFVGSVVALISAIGLIRFPDVYTRSHAATKSSTLAVLITLVGVLIFFLAIHNVFSVRLLLGITFVFLTSPVVGHLVSRSAYRNGVSLSDMSIEDELKEVVEKKKAQATEDREV